MRFALLLALPMIAVAADQCPWLSAATAAGALGGPVASVAVKPASCVFARSDGSSLTVEVRMLKSAKEFVPCKGEPLVGIGNEAVACGDTVAGRVRDQAFTIRMTASRDSREKVRKIAELVAGFLF